jgi:hypothetical protein
MTIHLATGDYVTRGKEDVESHTEVDEDPPVLLAARRKKSPMRKWQLGVEWPPFRARMMPVDELRCR